MRPSSQVHRRQASQASLTRARQVGLLAQAQRGQQVLMADSLVALEVGDRAGDAQDAVAAAGAQRADRISAGERLLGELVERHVRRTVRASISPLHEAAVPSSRARWRSRASATRRRALSDEVIGPG